MNRINMEALVYEGPRMMNIRQRPRPEPKDNEVLIHVKLAGICGSELSGYLGHNSLRVPPLVMGHEFSGTVVQTGERVAGFKPGDRVTANPLVSCGKCRLCKGGTQHLCPDRKLLGAHVSGAFAEFVSVSYENVYHLPDQVSFTEGAFVEPFACAVHACRLLKLAPEDRLLITGAGPIGLFALQAALVFGVKHIVITDLNEKRLEIARQLGAMAVQDLNALPEAGGSPEFDAAIDAVGVDVTRVQCVKSVRAGGRVVFSGLHQEQSEIPMNLAIRREVSMQGAFAYSPQDFEDALRWIAEGRTHLMPWTVHAPLEEGGASFEKLINGPGNIVKIMLDIPERA